MQSDIRQSNCDWPTTNYVVCVLYGTVYENSIDKCQNTGLVIWIRAGYRSEFHCDGSLDNMVSFCQGIRAAGRQSHAEFVLWMASEMRRCD